MNVKSGELPGYSVVMSTLRFLYKLFMDKTLRHFKMAPEGEEFLQPVDPQPASQLKRIVQNTEATMLQMLSSPLGLNQVSFYEPK